MLRRLSLGLSLLIAVSSSCLSSAARKTPGHYSKQRGVGKATQGQPVKPTESNSSSQSEVEARRHYLMGESAFKVGDYETAVSEWRVVMKLKPSSSYTSLMLAKAEAKLDKQEAQYAANMEKLAVRRALAQLGEIQSLGERVESDENSMSTHNKLADQWIAEAQRLAKLDEVEDADIALGHAERESLLAIQYCMTRDQTAFTFGCRLLDIGTDLGIEWRDLGVRWLEYVYSSQGPGRTLGQDAQARLQEIGAWRGLAASSNETLAESRASDPETSAQVERKGKPIGEGWYDAGTARDESGVNVTSFTNDSFFSRSASGDIVLERGVKWRGRLLKAGTNITQLERELGLRPMKIFEDIFNSLPLPPAF